MHGLTDWLVDWLIDWLIDWLTDWLIDWLTGWLIDWLIDWLIILWIVFYGLDTYVHCMRAGVSLFVVCGYSWNMLKLCVTFHLHLWRRWLVHDELWDKRWQTHGEDCMEVAISIARPDCSRPKRGVKNLYGKDLSEVHVVNHLLKLSQMERLVFNGDLKIALALELPSTDSDVSVKEHPSQTTECVYATCVRIDVILCDKMRSNDVIGSFTMYHTCHVGFVAGWTVDSSNIDFCTTARSKESVMKRMVASFRSGEGEFQPRIIASPYRSNTVYRLLWRESSGWNMFAPLLCIAFCYCWYFFGWFDIFQKFAVAVDYHFTFLINSHSIWSLCSIVGSMKQLQEVYSEEQTWYLVKIYDP